MLMTVVGRDLSASSYGELAGVRVLITGLSPTCGVDVAYSDNLDIGLCHESGHISAAHVSGADAGHCDAIGGGNVVVPAEGRRGDNVREY